MTTDPYWPLVDLRLAAADLDLRPLREEDLRPLADLLPDDLEMDPAATRFEVPEPQVRAIISHQGYWRSLGTWTPEAWRLSFAVRQGGRLIGVQELEGNDFPLLRTVDTSSFLVPDVRGRGLGKQMRTAVLALAFGPMQAQAAITEAWHDNLASLGVSRALGYLPNGQSLHARSPGPGERVAAAQADVMVHLRLTRADWLAAAREPVTIDGFEPCRPLFGL